jgi:hypothetical protein
MSATIKIKMDNAAFDEPAGELARILRDIAERIEQGEIMAFNLRDVNGNNVGTFQVKGTR